MRTAIAHDWLPVFSGAEQVVAQMMRVVGPSDLYTLFDFLDDNDRARIGARRTIVSSLNRLPFCEKYYRWTFPFCPRAMESFDLSGYDLVISSSAAFAKGVIVHPHQRHIAYVHTPVRYAWDQTYEYLARTPLSRPPLGMVLRRALHQLRIWDARTAHGPDVFLANSTVVKRRIEQIYGRPALVVAPPVDVDDFPLCEDKDDYFIVATRLVPYKRVDLVIDAFAQMPTRRLLVVGDGPEMARLRARQTSNVTFAGHLPRPKLVEAIQRARAFIFAAYEDFGIVMAEAQSAGTPVIAFGLGGARDIVVPLGADHPTGVLFAEQSADAIREAVERFCAQERRFTPAACHANAQRFNTEAFRARLRRVIDFTMQPDFARDKVTAVLLAERPSMDMRPEPLFA